MKEEEARKLAEKHWQYNRELLSLSGHTPTALERFLFIEAMVHMNKHNEEDSND